MTIAPAISDTDVTSVMRSPEHVMRLSRLGSFHQTRISFARTLIRRMAREKWRITIHHKQLDEKGIGRIIYQIDFLINEVPLQELGRFSANEFVLSRANKSVRLFEGVVNSLAAGKQPDINEIKKVGYLMRTTAVYGNGKFGLAEFEKVGMEKNFNLPFQAEMLSVYMTRLFTFDLIDHCARMRGGAKAIQLTRSIRRMLGVGNATGLGMAPYLVNHPKLLNNWITARETALARIRLIDSPTDSEILRVRSLIDKCRIHINEWPTTDQQQNKKILRIGSDLEIMRELLSQSLWFKSNQPWDRLMLWAEIETSIETQELLVSILMEPYGVLIDDLENTYSSDEQEETIPEMPLGELKKTIEYSYAWTLGFNFAEPNGNKYFWYRSAEKEEPRLGVRREEQGSELEMPIGIAHDVADLYENLDKYDDKTTTAEFLIFRPEFRRIVRRIQTLANLPYAEIRDNLIGAGCEPIDILRCKLSIFGATKFDPKSKLWTRITLFQGAPLPDELNLTEADDWFAPTFSCDNPA